MEYRLIDGVTMLNKILVRNTVRDLVCECVTKYRLENRFGEMNRSS